MPCNSTLASADGLWLHTQTPGPEALGCASGGECGHATLVLSNAATETYRGAAVACPPFCPGVAGVGGLVPLATSAVANSTAGSSVVLAVADAASGTVTALPSSLAAAGTGLYYAVKCAQSGLFTDPTTGACTNASDPASRRCAYGSGAACATCAEGAVCPGGSRAWARPGFFSSAESLQAPAACPPPDASGRCVGWDSLAGQTRCGAAYRQGSYLCGTCAAGSYAVGDGSCARCPTIAGAWDRYRGLLGLVIGVVCFGVAVFACVLGVLRVAGRSLEAGGKQVSRVVTLIVW